MVSWIEDQGIFQRNGIALLYLIFILCKGCGKQSVSDMHLNDLKYRTIGNCDICITGSNCCNRSTLYSCDLFTVCIPQQCSICGIARHDCRLYRILVTGDHIDLFHIRDNIGHRILFNIDTTSCHKIVRIKYRLYRNPYGILLQKCYNTVLINGCYGRITCGPLELCIGRIGRRIFCLQEYKTCGQEGVNILSLLNA